MIQLRGAMALAFGVLVATPGFAAFDPAVVVVAPNVDFDDNPIAFTPPARISGPGTVTNVTTPDQTPLSNGLDIQNLGYRVTASRMFGGEGRQAIITQWTADRDFTVSVPGIVASVSSGFPVPAGIKGSTDVTITGFHAGDSATLTVTEIIDPGTANEMKLTTPYTTTFSGTAFNGVTTPLSWMVPQTFVLAGGAHTMRELSTISWTNSTPFARIDLASDYTSTVGVAAVPEPSSLVLLAWGTLGLAGGAWWRRRSRTA